MEKSFLKRPAVAVIAAFALTACAPKGLEDAGMFHGKWPAQDIPVSSEARVETEALLSQLGYDPGAVDGAITRQTRTAIKRFQSDLGVGASGFISPMLLAALRANSSVELEVRVLEQPNDAPESAAPRSRDEPDARDGGGGGGGGGGSSWN